MANTPNPTDDETENILTDSAARLAKSGQPLVKSPGFWTSLPQLMVVSAVIGLVVIFLFRNIDLPTMYLLGIPAMKLMTNPWAMFWVFVLLIVGVAAWALSTPQGKG